MDYKTSCSSCGWGEKSKYGRYTFTSRNKKLVGGGEVTKLFLIFASDLTALKKTCKPLSSASLASCLLDTRTFLRFGKLWSPGEKGFSLRRNVAATDFLDAAN